MHSHAFEYIETHLNEYLFQGSMDTAGPSQFFNPTVSHIFTTYASYIAAITVLISPIYFYILLTQSSKLNTYKWLILNHSFWCFSFLLSFASVKPVVLLYCGCGFQTGVFRETSVITTIWALIAVLGCSIMSIVGVSMSLSYRYFGLFPGKVKTICHSPPMYCFFIAVHILLWILLIVCVIQLTKVPQETMIQQALEFSPELQPFTNEKTFIFLSEEIYKVASIIVLIVLVGFTMLFIFMMYLLKKELMSKLRSELQKNLIISVIAQVSVTLIFEFNAYIFLFSSIIFRIPNSGLFTEILEMLVVSHTFMEYCVTLYFVLPYRKFILKKLNAISTRFPLNKTAIHSIST